MVRIEWCRRILAFVALACLFLPLAQCSTKEDAPEPGQQLSATAAPQISRTAPDQFVPIQVVADSLDEWHGWFWLGMFTWPVAMLGVRSRVFSRRGLLCAHVAEILLSGGAIYYSVILIRLWGEIRIGGVLAIGSFVGLMLGALAGLAGMLQHRTD